MSPSQSLESSNGRLKIPTDRRFALRCLTLGTLVALSASPAASDEPPLPDEAPLTSADRNHWAFRPLVQPTPPNAGDPRWARTPVDRFLQEKLDSARLAPLPPADRATLIRRVTFDLTGLPPTPDEVDDFLANDRPDAWERLIDRLLASPSYGERWAQHWLDLARFAETDGFEHDLVRPNAWRYRDWVISALNDDLPIADFVRRQIAGDLLSPDDPSAALPTGFLLCGPDMPDLNRQDERRHNVLNEITGAIGAVFLGLQLGCAQCHDHKYDPISQADFYRMRAFFRGAELFVQQPVPTPLEQSAHDRAAAEFAPEVRQIEARLKALEDAARRTIRDHNPDLEPAEKDLLAAMSDSERADFQALQARRNNGPQPPPLPLGRVVREGPPKPTPFLVRGDFRRPGPELEPAFVRIGVVSPPAPPPSNANTLPRRQLADWLAENPLAARVLANRIWQHHFGEGLVRTPSDFGLMGDRPTHPELLEWLAAQTANRTGASEATFKSLHRLLLTSSAYRRASLPRSADWTDAERSAARASWNRSREVDPGNRLLARANRQRLDGEAIRDAMLAAAGTLSQRRGGPGVRPPLPPEIVSTLLRGQWDVTPEPADHSRRSIYLFVRRNLRFPLFEAFDRPDANASCPRRNRSTIAPQALVLLNSESSLDAARALAARVMGESDPAPAARIERAWRLALARPPLDDEREAALEFLKGDPSQNSGDRGAPPDEAALVDLCLALFNTSEFVYVD